MYVNTLKLVYLKQILKKKKLILLTPSNICFLRKKKKDNLEKNVTLSITTNSDRKKNR